MIKKEYENGSKNRPKIEPKNSKNKYKIYSLK